MQAAMARRHMKHQPDQPAVGEGFKGPFDFGCGTQIPDFSLRSTGVPPCVGGGGSSIPVTVCFWYTYCMRDWTLGAAANPSKKLAM